MENYRIFRNCLFCNEKITERNDRLIKKYCNTKCANDHRRQIKNSKIINENSTCRKCNEFKDLIFFSIHNGKRTNVCKNCANLTKKNQREQKRSLFKESGDVNDLQFFINWWASKTRGKGTLDKFRDRRNLSKDYLILLAEEGLRKFPYLDFANITNKIGYRASLDRIDPNKTYEEANVQVIPMWLNSAKIDLTEQEFHEKLDHYQQLRKSEENECLYDGLYDATESSQDAL